MSHVAAATDRLKRPGTAVYTVRLRPEPGVDGIRALRRALKYCRRVCGLRAVSIEETHP
jgi:hypothetical protein